MQVSCQLPMPVVSGGQIGVECLQTATRMPLKQQKFEARTLAPPDSQLTLSTSSLLDPNQCANRAGFEYLLGH